MDGVECAISFVVLSGAKDESPFAYLLNIDDFHILLDCGWTDDFNEDQLQSLIDHCAHIDAVLISHCTVQHIGALPYLCQHHGLSAPVYATAPVKSLGSLLLFDCYMNKRDECDFRLFSATDIRRTFDSIYSMTYGQEMRLGDNIIVTPYNAGRSIGSAVWRITKGENEVLYTNSIWQGNDRLLDRFAMSPEWHPTLWILDARAGAGEKQKPVDEFFFKQIRMRVDQGNIVLLPVDGVSRALEILFLLNEHWTQRSMPRNIYFLSHTSKQVVETVNQLAEWLNESVKKMVLETTLSPFDLEKVEYISEMSDLPQGGVVVLATSDSLEHGFSRKIFLQSASRPNQLVFFTTRQPRGSLAESLRTDNTHRDIELLEQYREPLTGAELLQFRQMRDLERAGEATIDRFSSSDEPSDYEGPEEPDKVVVPQTLKNRFQFASQRRQSPTDYGSSIDHSEYAKGIQHAALVDEQTAQQILAPVVIRSIVEEPEDVPSKFVQNKLVFQFRATCDYFDFEARTNFFQLKALLQKYSPQHIIIIGAGHEPTMQLHDIIKDCMKTIVSTPGVGENVYLTPGQSAMKIGLSRALYNRLDFKKVNDFNEVAFLDAVLAADDMGGRSARPVEHALPHHANFIGKISMPALRDLLTERGMTTTFKGGIFVGARKIEVRQVGENTIAVEGPMCADFIKIRNIIQEMLPMV
jgi:cleavage and polyadenylation specificity factor subunit 2